MEYAIFMGSAQIVSWKCGNCKDFGLQGRDTVAPLNATTQTLDNRLSPSSPNPDFTISSHGDYGVHGYSSVNFKSINPLKVTNRLKKPVTALYESSSVMNCKELIHYTFDVRFKIWDNNFVFVYSFIVKTKFHIIVLHNKTTCYHRLTQ